MTCVVNIKADAVDELKKVPMHIVRKIEYWVNAVEKYGIEAVLPHIKKISGTRLWEIRILGKDNLRIIYFVNSEETVVLLDGFFKKTQKTSKKDLNRALSYFEDWKRRFDK